jgi:hypothetical protein
MDPLTIAGGIMALAKPVLDRFFPDPKVRQEFELAMRGLDWQLIAGQLEINKAEAANPRLFVSGWRPFIGWVGGVGLAWQFVLAPICAWALSLFSPGTPLPVLDGSGELMALVTALLGIGAMRSYDKTKGTSK